MAKKVTSPDILDVVSKELIELCNLRPLQEGETAEFVLLNAGRIDKNSSKKVSCPQAWISPPSYKIKDVFDKETPNKEILNIISYKTVQVAGHGSIFEPVTDYLRFGSTGRIVKTHLDDQTELYFLRLHNKNISNPNRTGNSVRFKEVDSKAETSLKNNIFEYKAISIGLVSEIGEDEVLLSQLALKMMRSYPSLYAFNLTDPIDKLKTALLSVADKNPVDVIRSMKEQNSYTRFIVDDCLERRLIVFDKHPSKLNWMWNTMIMTKIPAKDVIILKTSSEKAARKELIEFLVSEKGSVHLLNLREVNEKYYK